MQFPLRGIISLHAIDQPLVNTLCSIIYKLEYDEELTEKEMDLYDRIIDDKENQ